ncbi:MAG: hypothetical protein MUF21_15525, partial [Gemmatimonadaceae bacterium]|nr:hypothetical protein [Gemmatimonadaceae bacterium]
MAVAVIDVVLHAGAPRGDEARGARGARRVDDAPLRLREARGADPHERAAPEARDAHVEEHVRLVEDGDVGAHARAEAVPPDAVVALGAVGRGVEQRPVVARPCQPEAELLLAVGAPAPGAQVLHPEGEILVAGGVDEQGEERAVGRDLERAEAVELPPLRGLVLVEDHLLRRVERPALAAEDRVRLPLLGARVVPPRAVAIG